MPKAKNWHKGALLLIIVVVLLVVMVGAAFYLHAGRYIAGLIQNSSREDDSVYVSFDMEAYDQIKADYWMATSTYDLPHFFQVSLGKLANIDPKLPTDDRNGTLLMLQTAFSSSTMSTTTKAALALNIVNLVTYNLLPIGKNRLLTSQQNTAISNEVINVNPAHDLYKDLGVSASSSPQEVQAGYEKKAAALKNATSTEARDELKQAEYAYQVLTKNDSKDIYDQAKVEPTVFSHILGKTLYIYIQSISPRTLYEFSLAVSEASTTPGLDSMIIDLRDDIGGEFTFAQSFLAMFIGPNQYAFDLFRQGDYKVQRTSLLKWLTLDRYKEIAILTNSSTKSTAEVVTAAFERYHLAKVIGTKTGGWGTVEGHSYDMKTPIDPGQSFTLLLVEYLTLGPYNQPIESLGVTPDIDTGQLGWDKQLDSVFRSTSLIHAVDQLATKPPVK